VSGKFFRESELFALTWHHPLVTNVKAVLRVSILGPKFPVTKSLLPSIKYAGSKTKVFEPVAVKDPVIVINASVSLDVGVTVKIIPACTRPTDATRTAIVSRIFIGISPVVLNHPHPAHPHREVQLCTPSQPLHTNPTNVSGSG